MQRRETALQSAYTSLLSDGVMSLLAVLVVGSAAYRWGQGFDVQDSHAISVGVIVAYFFARNHLSALNEARREGTAREVTSEIQDAMRQPERGGHDEGARHG